MGAVTKKPLINRNLISLKCVLFIFFGGEWKIFFMALVGKVQLFFVVVV
jgi:hypothetical protein